MKKFFIVGKPLSHTASPHIYNRVFSSRGIGARYEPLEVDVEGLREFVKFVAREAAGFNVTVPHKTTVVPLLDELDATAREIGAVNTVLNVNEKLFGYNTDWIGVRRSLERFHVLRGLGEVLVVGAGGAARGVVYALRDSARRVVVLSRTGFSAKELAALASRWGLDAVGLEASNIAVREILGRVDLLINASPVGTLSWESPVPEDSLHPGLIVMDLVYNPLRTRLLAAAESAGCTTIDGLWVLCYQAAENLKIWLGLDVEVEELRSYGMEFLGSMQMR